MMKFLACYLLVVININLALSGPKTSGSPLISAQLPQSPVLLTEHQIKKVRQLCICGLRGKLLPTKKTLKSILPVSFSPRHHRSSLCSSTNEHSSFKDWFTLLVTCCRQPPLLPRPLPATLLEAKKLTATSQLLFAHYHSAFWPFGKLCWLTLASVWDQ